MQLFTLMFGKSKNRMKPIMIDSFDKCQNYMKARENNVQGWHKIVISEMGSDVWRRKNCIIKGGGDKHNTGPSRVGYGDSGYINKGGFHPNT